MLEDTDNGQLEDIDVIPNEDMLLVCGSKSIKVKFVLSFFHLLVSKLFMCSLCYLLLSGT